MRPLGGSKGRGGTVGSSTFQSSPPPKKRPGSVATIKYMGFSEIFREKVILIETPYEKNFIDALKLNVPAKKRLYSDFDKAWITMLDQFDKIAHICEKYFDEVQLFNFPEPQVAASSWGKLYLVEGAPLEVVRAAYKALAIKYHPDKGGDQEIMKNINIAYKDILGELKNGD